MVTLLSLLTHRRILVRAATGLLIGTLIFFGAWAASWAWLPEGSFVISPLPSIITCEGSAANAVRIFAWNIILTGGLVALSSLVAVGRFPYGYVIPWVTFAIYGGMLGTNSSWCGALPEPLAPSIGVLWTRAGYREIAGYLLIAAALANQFLWRQQSFFGLRVERVRSFKALKLDLDARFGLCLAVLLVGWGAAVEVMS